MTVGGHCATTHQKDWRTLEEPRRFGPAHRTDVGAAPGMDMGQTAWPVPRLIRIGKPGQLRL